MRIVKTRIQIIFDSDHTISGTIGLPYPKKIRPDNEDNGSVDAMCCGRPFCSGKDPQHNIRCETPN